MLKNEILRCSIYDSTVARKNMIRTPERTVRYYELEVYHTESGTCFVDGTAYPITRGMLLCARPGQVRYSHLPIRSSYVWVSPDPDTEAVLNALPVCTHVDDPQAAEQLLTLFDGLRSSLSAQLPEPEGAVSRSRQLLAILEVWLQQCRSRDHSPVRSRLIREACRYMDSHFCESCRLSEIAAHVHVSANHLHTVFLHSEGKTPYEYVTRKRIEKAQAMILAGDHSLAQIALETGFCSQSHFAAVFKKITGQTPARYRGQLFDLN